MAGDRKQALKGKVVVVTGATSGIGWSTALRFASEGARVVGTGRDQERLHELSAHCEQVFSMDVTQQQSVEVAAAAITDSVGAPDILINNAGIGLFKSWSETSVDDVKRVLDVNLYGVIRVSRALLPAMIERGSGQLINIASVAGRRGYANHTAYCSSKHALMGWSEGMRCDLLGTGVEVTVVCPPAVRTPFFENAGYMTFDEDHPGLDPMTADEVAEGILSATLARRRVSILSTRAKVLYGLSVVAPDLLDRIRGYK